MSKFYGKIGFAITYEDKPGIFKEAYEEKPYKGDVIRNSRRWESTDSINDDITINNDISIISDTFAKEHFGVMRYVYWMNQYFEISSATIDTERHRITLSLGGVFNVQDSD